MPEASTRHHGEADRVQAAGPLVEAKLEILGHAAGLRAVVERHHEDGQEDHGGDGPDPVEMAGGDAVLCPAGAHADEFQGPQVGRDERQAGDPGGDGPAGLEEIGAVLHRALQRESDSQDEDDVDGKNCVVDNSPVRKCMESSPKVAVDCLAQHQKTRVAIMTHDRRGAARVVRKIFRVGQVSNVSIREGRPEPARAVPARISLVPQTLMPDRPATRKRVPRCRACSGLRRHRRFRHR